MTPDAVRELAPAGTLRAGLVRAPRAGVFFVAPGPDGEPQGTAATLFHDLARHTGLPLAFTLFPNSGECTEALAAAAIDVAFMPVDEFRRGRVSFGPGYFELESTFLVSAASGITTLAEADRPGTRAVGIAGTTTIRAAARALTRTEPIPVRTVEEVFAMLADGRADAVALSRDVLDEAAPGIPGSRVLAEAFQRTSISIAVPPGRPAALALVSAWLPTAPR